MRRLFLAVMAAFCLSLCGGANAARVVFDYEPDGESVFVNPFIGNVAWAEDDNAGAQPFSLVYANLRWADFEPEQGRYDFESFERENHLERWRAEGKRLILRFVADVPGKKKHLDIPEWLYAQTADGVYYHTSYGRGYSPNYENETLIAAHARAIQALGGRYGGDSFVAFVELGSLGHWGEWHVHDDIGELPGADVRQRYVEPYLLAFPNAYLLARRPFGFAAADGFGLYNDASGAPEATEQWLAWIASGGDYQGEEDALSPMPLKWRTSPIGGELATSMEAEEYLGECFDKTLDLFRASHTSWIGPHSFVNVEVGGERQPELDALLRAVGYRLRIKRATLELDASGTRSLTLAWHNDGIAPFYFDWPARLRLSDGSGKLTELDLPMRVGDILPGGGLETTVALPSGSYDVALGIADPSTGEAGVFLAMRAPRSGCWYSLFSLE